MIKMIKKIKEVVEKNPNRIAYKVSNNFITYKELWDKAYKYGELLKREGTSPVIIFGHKDVSIIISILACLIANRTYVPIGECTPIYRLKKIIEMTNSTLILSNKKLKIDNNYSLDDLVKFEKKEIIEFDNNIVYIIFTSGSTGDPKGVPISKDNLNNFINWLCNLEPLKSYKNINVLNQASFSFDLSVADLYYSLCNGHTLIAFDSDYNEILDVMYDVNVAVMTPTFIKLCLLDKDFTELNYPNLRCIYFCGEQLESKTVQKLYNAFPNIKIINAYGPTEATSAVSAVLITKEMSNNMKILPIGELNNFATEICLIDDEIVLKGKSVFSGYISNNNLGYYKENNTNCYKTGDIGYIEDGYLYCKGRKDNQVKFKGYRIELSDIEYNINLIDGVKECAVVAKYNDELVVKTIKAFVVLDKKIELNYIKDELKKLIPEYMIPKSLKIIDRLPINQNGKIDRKALSEL